MIILLFVIIAAAILYFAARSRREQNLESEMRTGLSGLPTGERMMKNGGRFELKVEDVFSLNARGTVVTGQVASGKVRVGDSVMIRR